MLTSREAKNETYYYSSVSQLDELLQYLERDGEEERLLSILRSWYDEIVRQMAITKELTNSFKGKNNNLGRQFVISEKFVMSIYNFRRKDLCFGR